jgi:hypothetical protein
MNRRGRSREIVTFISVSIHIYGLAGLTPFRRGKKEMNTNEPSYGLPRLGRPVRDEYRSKRTTFNNWSRSRSVGWGVKPTRLSVVFAGLIMRNSPDQIPLDTPEKRVYNQNHEKG